jgi:hypothetical protein
MGEGPHSLLRQRNAHPHIARADPRCGIAGSSGTTVSAWRVAEGDEVKAMSEWNLTKIV